MAKALKGRRVRCMVTGEVGTSLTFYKAPDGHYYKSKEVYDKRPFKEPRKVRCFATGEWGLLDEFFKAPDGHYYKDESVYEQYKDNAAIYIKLMDDIRDTMAFDPSMAFPTIITRTLKDLSQFYGYGIILETFERCKSSIGYAMRSKTFQSEYARAAYVMAILKNNINDVYLEHKRNQKAAEFLQRQDSQVQEADNMNFADIGYVSKTKRDRSFFNDD